MSCRDSNLYLGHATTPQTIQSPDQNRSLARYTCNVQVYGPDSRRHSNPWLRDAPSPGNTSGQASRQAWVAIRWVRAFEGKVESSVDDTSALQTAERHPTHSPGTRA
jgi:hypothetical protein